MANELERGEELLAHLDAAYNLARWLVKNEQDARDVVQDSFVKAIKFNGSVENLKAWFLAVVRNQAYTAVKKRIPLGTDDDLPFQESEIDQGPSPEEMSLRAADLEIVRGALLLLSDEHREVFILREVEDLSYQELATVLNIQVGTVMSRLARARIKILEIVRAEEQRQERVKQ